MEVTGTFKLMKGDLRREGYDLSHDHRAGVRDEAGADRCTSRSISSFSPKIRAGIGRLLTR